MERTDLIIANRGECFIAMDKNGELINQKFEQRKIYPKEMPTKVSQLENDSNFATEQKVKQMISENHNNVKIYKGVTVRQWHTPGSVNCNINISNL